MLSHKLAAKYAHALCELAKEKDILSLVEQQLTLVVDSAAANEDLKTLMYHPLVPSNIKRETVIRLFGGELDVTVKNFLLLVIDKHREAALPAILHEYTKLANEARNIVVADVTTAIPLAADQEQKLSDKLSAMTGKTVRIRGRIDARIIGGVIVKIGDMLIDGSVARQLSNLEAALTKIPLTKIGVTG